MAVLREDISVSQNRANWVATVLQFWRQTAQTLPVQKEANTDTKTLRSFRPALWAVPTALDLTRSVDLPPHVQFTC